MIVSTPFNMYPDAIFLDKFPKMKTINDYKMHHPEGAIIHYTAGRQEQSGEAAIQHAIEQGYCYFFINQAGMVYQQFDLDRYGQHAGLSKCPVTGRTNVSKYYVGIEIACAGYLENGKTWYGEKVPSARKRANDKGEFQIYTVAQEKALLELCTWLCLGGSNPEYFFGHDEVTNRKLDPGASLSMTMNDFRIKLKEIVDGIGK